MQPHEAVAAEVRAELARQKFSGARAARELGWTQGYISGRLTGVTPFDAGDLIALGELLSVAPGKFFERAIAEADIRTPGFCRPLAAAA